MADDKVDTTPPGGPPIIPQPPPVPLSGMPPPPPASYKYPLVSASSMEIPIVERGYRGPSGPIVPWDEWKFGSDTYTDGPAPYTRYFNYTTREWKSIDDIENKTPKPPEQRPCANCGKSTTLKCGKCGQLWACGKPCMTVLHKGHKKDCNGYKLNMYKTVIGRLGEMAIKPTPLQQAMIDMTNRSAMQNIYGHKTMLAGPVITQRPSIPAAPLSGIPPPPPPPPPPQPSPPPRRFPSDVFW